MSRPTARRRFLQITAACAGLGLVGATRETPASGPASLSWRGVALGNLVGIDVVHPDSGRARAVLRAASAEVRRLELVFSLYEAGSALVALNRTGRLAAPPEDLVRALAEARSVWNATGGAFDVTVQPLWNAYATHFFAPGADPAGPKPTTIERAVALVDFRAVEIDASEVRLPRPGMAVTLNGIAQGYMTDRITELLRNEGISDVLVDLGELRAGGTLHGPWKARIKAPDGNDAGEVALLNQALATSGGYGFRFDPDGRFHHIYDPHSGRCPRRYASVSVIAPDATRADALATAFNLMPVEAIAPALRATRATRAILLHSDGRLSRVEAGAPA